MLASRVARAPIANTPPTSGNAFSRGVLEKILPMPAADWRICADGYLLVVSALHGAVAATDEPLARYRVHRKNNWAVKGVPTTEHLLKLFDIEARKAAALRGAARGLGIAIAADWELGNPGYLDFRLFMLVHHPDQHPFPADTVGQLARIGVRTSLSSGASPRAILKAALYASLPLLPGGATAGPDRMEDRAGNATIVSPPRRLTHLSEGGAAQGHASRLPPTKWTRL